MGMHHGILAAQAGADLLIAAANMHVKTLLAGDRRGSLDDFDLASVDEGWKLAYGEFAGQSYLLDTSMVLSTAPDLVVALSRDLDALIVGCGGETTSGSYWFFAAERGVLRRGYWNCYADMTAPWSQGEPVLSEERVPLEDVDGAGMMAALTSLGFDYDAWAQSDTARGVFYRADTFPQTDTVGHDLEAFRRSVAIPEGKQPKPRVVRRQDGGVDLVTASASQKKGGLLGFLRRR